MWIEIESIEGPLASARKTLATKIATDSLSWLADVVRGVVIRLPAKATGERTVTASVVVVLRDGKRFDALAVEENVADALERACHEARREIANAIGRPLRRRRGAEESTFVEADRRTARG